MTKSKIKQIQKNVAGTLAVENKKASGKAKNINRKYLEGKITSEQAVKQIKEVYGL